MANTGGLPGYDFDLRNAPFQYASRLSWPLHQHPAFESASNPPPRFKRSTSPLPVPMASQSMQHTSNPQSLPQTETHAPMMPNWAMPSPAPASTFALDTTSFAQPSFHAYGMSYQASPTDYTAPHPSLQASFEAMPANALPLETSYLGLDGHLNELSEMNPMASMPFDWPGMAPMNHQWMGYTATNAMAEMAATQQTFVATSPSDGYLSETHLEVRSLTGSSSDNGWATVDHVMPPTGAIFDPERTLHPRSLSDSSYSDVDYHHPRSSWDGHGDASIAMSSPTHEDSSGEVDCGSDRSPYHGSDRPSPPAMLTTTLVQPIAITKPTSPQRAAPTSPTKSRPRRTSIMKTAGKTTVIRRASPTHKDTEKRVGRRKGPLRPEQRKQAGEIRKLGACLRCRFLKKVCDAGEPCGGCQPSHARLWQVPCTRIDIKDLAYFMKDWTADYQRHISLGFSIGNIKGFADDERTLYITHGYGQYFPVQAREVYVRDERCFGVDWMENNTHEFGVNTAKLSIGPAGIAPGVLSDYLDRHLDTGFESFVDNYFEGTPFITQILKTAFRFWMREKTPVIRKALKFVLAYNLTQHVTMVVGLGEEDHFEGKVDTDASKYHGQTVAPVMINFQVKCGLADMWRALQKDILDELSTLYSSVYTKEKLRHWPTIFLLACILLAVWEEMQWDCHYRIPDAALVDKFCNDMETTPVGVIAGLFGAISQKLPAVSEWETDKHHAVLGSNPAVCSAMEEVRDSVLHHDDYLRGRAHATFDRDDFDSLSNKFVSKLVIKAN